MSDPTREALNAAKAEPPSPATVAIAMRRAISDAPDDELAHRNADQILCEVLRALGYGEAVDIFEAADKWYA